MELVETDEFKELTRNWTDAKIAVDILIHHVRELEESHGTLGDYISQSDYISRLQEQLASAEHIVNCTQEFKVSQSHRKKYPKEQT